MKLKHLITEKDNDTACPLRIVASAFSFFYLGASCAFLHDFMTHCQEWATGAVSIAGIWATVVAKANFTEKGAQDVSREN